MTKYHFILPLIIFLSACAGNSSISDTSLSSEELEENVMSSEFNIDPTRDTTIFGESGTRIFIESNSFQFHDGTPVTETVTIQLEEYYTKTEIALADLSTSSSDELLESGGMLYIAAESNGNEVEIVNGNDLVVHFPTKSYKKDDMQLFYAGEQSSDDAVMDWNLDKSGNVMQKTLTLGNYGWLYPEHDDSTEYDFQPKDFGDKDVYYWNPIDFYVKSFDWSEKAISEITTTENKTKLSNLNPNVFDDWNTFGIECAMKITKEGYIKNVRIHTPISDSTKAEVKRFLYNIPQLEPGKNMHGEIIEREGYMLITEGRAVQKFEKRENYMKSFDEKYAEFEDVPITSMDKAEAEYYIFNVAQLGWINCDRFLYLEEEDKTDLFVDYKVSDQIEFKMIFSEINSVIQARNEDGKYYFPNVPNGEWVTIFGMKNTDGKIETFFKKKLISEKEVQDIAFEEITLSELKEELNNL